VSEGPYDAEQHGRSRTTGAEDLCRSVGTTPLSRDQYKQVYDINLDFISKLGAAKQNTGGKMAKFKMMKDADQNRDAAMKKILTDDQFKNYQTNKQENRKELKDRYRNKQN
jgi:hypothetical protein